MAVKGPPTALRAARAARHRRRVGRPWERDMPRARQRGRRERRQRKHGWQYRAVAYMAKHELPNALLGGVTLSKSAFGELVNGPRWSAPIARSEMAWIPHRSESTACQPPATRPYRPLPRGGPRGCPAPRHPKFFAERRPRPLASPRPAPCEHPLYHSRTKMHALAHLRASHQHHLGSPGCE